MNDIEKLNIVLDFFYEYKDDHDSRFDSVDIMENNRPLHAKIHIDNSQHLNINAPVEAAN